MSLKKLLASFGRGSSSPKEPPVPVDPWKEFSNALPTKLDWARSIDVAAIADEAKSSPENVERIAGYPGLWLEFGAAVLNPEHVPLEDVVALGKKVLATGIDSDLWSWYQAYMRSPVGRGEIPSKEYNLLPRADIYFLHKAIDFRTYIGSRLTTYATFRDYHNAVVMVGDLRILTNEFYGENGEYLASDFDRRKDELLDAAHAACKGLDDLIAFFRSIPTSGDRIAFWADMSGKQWKVAFEIHDIVAEQIKAAATTTELGKVNIPWGIYTQGISVTERLTDARNRRHTELAAVEEEERVRARLKMAS